MKKIYLLILLMVAGGCLQAQTLVASYPFNGNANDATGNPANNGTVSGATLTTDRFGNANSAYNFDGVDDYISGSAANYPTGDRTVSIWFNADAGSIALQPGMLGYGGGACGSSFFTGINNLSSPLKYQLQGHCLSNSNQYAYSAAPESNWYNWVITVSGTTSKMYINGVLVSTAATFTTGTTVAGTDFIFGDMVNVNGIGPFPVNPGNTSYFKGKLDDIKVYNGALTDAQVFDAYVNDLRKPGSGNGLLFPGRLPSNQAYVNTGNGWDSQVFTFECWVRKDENDANQTLMASKNAGGWGVGLAGDGAGGIPADRLYITKVGIDNTYSAATINDFKWHHIAVTYDGAAAGQKVHFYIDGIESAPNNPAYSSTYNSSNGDYYLGGLDAGTASELNGVLDEVRVWNVILNQTQIRDWMCRKISSSHPAYANLKGYFRFDEGSSTTTGGYNAKFGTLVNSPTWITSGAALGDASTHDYVNVTKTANISHVTGENFSATETSGTPAGIHVYRVDENPNSTTGANNGGNNKYFGVFQVGGTSPQYTAVYNYTGNPLVTGGNESSLRLAKRTDNTVTIWTQLSTLPNEPANTITVTGESTEYILGSLGSPLSVTILNFAGSKCNSGICLLWVTENEQNFSHFEVEKSTDGRNFAAFNNVTARNTSERNSYTSTDNNPVNGDNFYRLKIINLDGSFKYSAVIRVTPGKPEQVSLQPNPASDIVVIKGLFGYSQLRIIDMSGKIRQQKNIQASIEELNISHLSAGIYIVQLINEKETTSIKLVKY